MKPTEKIIYELFTRMETSDDILKCLKSIKQSILQKRKQISFYIT